MNTYDKQKLQNDIQSLLNEYVKSDNIEFLNKIEHKFEMYLENNPDDRKTFLQYIIFEYLPQIADDMKAKELLLDYLDKHPNDCEALLLLAYIVYNWYRFDQNVLDKLENAQSADPEIMSMIEYAKSWYYYHNESKYIASIIKSVNYSHNQVYNLRELAYIYEFDGNMEIAKQLFMQAMKNIKAIYIPNHAPFIPSINEFLNERYKGINLGKWNYQDLIASFNKLNEK